MNNNIENKKEDSLKKAIEFWKDSTIIEQSEGSFTTKDGSVIGLSSTTFSAQPKTEDIEAEILPTNLHIEENNSVANQGLEIYDTEKRAFDDLNKAQPKEYTALVGKEWKEAVDQLRKSEEEKYFDNDK